MITGEPHYERRNGALIFIGDHADELPMGASGFAVFFDSCRGTILQHGDAAKVEAFARSTRTKYAALGRDSSPLTVLSFGPDDLGDDLCDEINACLACHGRIKRFYGELMRNGGPATF